MLLKFKCKLRSKTNNWDCKEKSRYSTGECGHFQNDHSAKCSPPTNSSHNQSPPNTSESQSCKQTSCAHIQQPDQGSTPGLDEVNDPAGQSDSELQNQDYENRDLIFFFCLLQTFIAFRSHLHQKIMD